MNQQREPRAKIPEKCPSCESGLVVTRLECPNCGTEVSGRFQARPISRLTSDEQDFVLHFVRNKGNLKEMERELGVSYWVMRRRLDQIAGQLHPEGTSAARVDGDGRDVVVRHLERIDLDPERAREVIQSLRERTGKSTAAAAPKADEGTEPAQGEPGDKA